MTTRGGDVGEELIEAFGTELMRISRRNVESPEGARLEMSAFRLLRLVVHVGPGSMRWIAETLQLEQSTVSRQVASAERAGLLERSRESGGSVQLVRATELGEQDYHHDLDLRSTAIRQALVDLGPEQVEVLVGGLRAFSDAVDRATPGGTQVPPPAGA